MKQSTQPKNYNCLHCQRQYCASQIANAHTCIVDKKKAVFESVDDSKGIEVCQVCDRSVKVKKWGFSFKNLSQWVTKSFPMIFEPAHKHAKAYH